MVFVTIVSVQRLNIFLTTFTKEFKNHFLCLFNYYQKLIKLYTDSMFNFTKLFKSCYFLSKNSYSFSKRKTTTYYLKKSN